MRTTGSSHFEVLSRPPAAFTKNDKLSCLSGVSSGLFLDNMTNQTYVSKQMFGMVSYGTVGYRQNFDAAEELFAQRGFSETSFE